MDKCKHEKFKFDGCKRSCKFRDKQRGITFTWGLKETDDCIQKNVCKYFKKNS